MKNYRKALKYAGAVILAATLGACASTRTQESAGEYVDNSAITTKVKSALLNDKHIKSLPINVKTYKGVVQLSGFVDDRSQANRASAIARRVEGVRAVQNDLVVK